MSLKKLKFALAFCICSTAFCCKEDNCVTCSENSQNCEKCKDGYWLHDNFCLACTETCEQCTNATYCSKCKANFHEVGYCRSPCYGNCDERGCNDTTGECYGCHNGFYGPYCKRNCDECVNGSCGIHQCTDGCIDGYTDVFGPCVKCIKNCKTCKEQGDCDECFKGSYRFRSEEGHGSHIILCLSCLSSCEECKSDGDCMKCEPGKYGHVCQYNCHEPNCYRCSGTRGVSSQCTECIAGFRLDDDACVPETVCSQNCDHNGCDQNGHCIGECKDRWTGKTCTSQCASRCQRCDQSDWKLCTTCKDDSYTTACNIMCSSRCLRLSGKTCRLKDGYCLNGCTDGYWGSNCSNACNEGCNSARCNQDDGYCETCYRYYYGAACQHACSENCKDNGTAGYICRKSDGRCELGCSDEYKGDYCDITSSPRITISTSEVLYSGESDEQNDGQNGNIVFFLGMVAGVGLCLMVTLVTCVACLRIRKKRKQKSDCQIDGEKREYASTAGGTFIS